MLRKVRCCHLRTTDWQRVRSLPPNDAHLPRDGSAAPSQSDAGVPSTQAAFTNSHHGGVPLATWCWWSLSGYSPAAVCEDSILIEPERRASSSSPTVECIMKINIKQPRLQAPSVSVEQAYVLECHANTQPIAFVTYTLFSVTLCGKWITTLVFHSHAHIHAWTF